MLTELVIPLTGAAVKWVIYTALLWFMIKIQKLHYHLPGLLASSAISILISFIPYAGPYLGHAVLLFCLWKCTGADFVPDILFTTSIAGALMFCVNLFVIGSLMGNLRPDLAAARETESPGTEMNVDVPEDDDDIEPAESPEPLKSTKTVAPAKPNKAPASAGQPQGQSLARQFTLKGVSLHSAQPLAMFAAGGRVYSLGTGESVMVQLAETSVPIRCEAITRDSVVLTTRSGEKIALDVLE